MPRVSRETQPTPPPKPTPHPAMWSQQILDKLDEIIPRGLYLDPYAGTGKILTLERAGRAFLCVEIEQEWADRAGEWIQFDKRKPQTYPMICGDSLALMKMWKLDGTRFDGVVSSPVYGNRMSDHHDAKDDSRRRGYKFQLGHMPHRNSSATLYFWQDSYQTHHKLAVKRIGQVVREGGMVFWNVKNFYKTKGGIEYEYDLVSWFAEEFAKRGFVIEEIVEVLTPGFRHGENYEIRKDAEHIIIGRKK